MGTGSAHANQMIESMIIIFNDLFFFGVTSSFCRGSINLIRMII